MASIFPSVTGLLQGFNERHEQYRQEQMQLEQERNKRETAVFNTLLSSPDPEVQALAASGMLTGAMGPSRKGGLRGWIGDMSTNPVTGKIRDLITQSQQSAPGTIPSRSITGLVPGEPGSAAEVSTQTTRAGQPPPAATTPDQAKPWTDVPPTVGQPPPTAGGAPETTPPAAAVGGPPPIQGLQIGPQTSTPSAQRRIFPTPEDLATQKYRGEYTGEIQGISDALYAADPNPDRAKARADAAAAARDHFLRSRGVGAAGGLQLTHGKDAQGNDVEGMFDKRPGSPTYGQVLHVGTDQPIEGFVAASVSAPRSTDREGISRELFNKPFSALNADEAKQVNDRMVQFRGQLAGAQTTGRGTAAADIPLSTEQRFSTIHDYSQQWNALQQPVREMQRNLLTAQSALANYERDPNGSSQAVLKAFETILDPRETGVRASDFGLTKAGQDLFDRAQAAYQRIIQGGGQGVTKENLAALVSTAQAIVGSMQNFNTGHRQRIHSVLTAGGIDPSLVLGADDVPDPGTGKAPGTVGTPPPTGATGGGGSVPKTQQQPDGSWVIIR